MNCDRRHVQNLPYIGGRRTNRIIRERLSGTTLLVLNTADVQASQEQQGLTLTAFRISPSPGASILSVVPAVRVVNVGFLYATHRRRNA
jgi:hypothetical protein